MRLFTGLSIPENVRQQLESVLDTLRAVASLKWSPPENLHITARFIGAWPEERLDEMKQALTSIEHVGTISVKVANFGFFPNPHAPQVFFAGVSTGPELPLLHQRLNGSLAALGCPGEQNSFSPHITLARIKRGQEFRPMREKIASLTNFDFGTFDAREFHLYESQPSARGSVYTKLATFPTC